MKQHSKIGNRPGKPAYRTPSPFRYRKYVNVLKVKHSKQRDIKKDS